MGDTKDLTKAEIDKFLKGNQHGILAMAGENPYALPMGYRYLRRTVILGLVKNGRKMSYIQKSKRVCFTICRPRWQTPGQKIPCTTAVIEGTLEEITNRAYYGLKRDVPENLQLYKLKIKKLGARKCNRKPCELFAQKSNED